MQDIIELESLTQGDYQGSVMVLGSEHMTILTLPLSLNQ